MSVSELHETVPESQRQQSEKPKKMVVKKESSWIGSALTLSVAVGVSCGILAANHFEKEIDNFKFVPMETFLHHPIFPAVFTVLYLLTIFTLSKVMKNREPVNSLKTVMLIHNWILSAGSAIMFIQIIREVTQFGSIFSEEVTCDSKGQHPQSRVYFWYYVFYLSKFYELLDTVFICLKKRPLIFLHVYHHIITMWLCWVCLQYSLSIQWLSTSANTLIHVFMYFYYACLVLKVDVWWKKYMTTLQIIQFVVDLAGNFGWSYYKVLQGYDCSGNWFSHNFGDAVLISFLLLFIDFYRKSYKKKPEAVAKKVQ